MLLNFVPKEFVLVAGLLAVPATVGLAQDPAAIPKNDPRLLRLQQYFADRKSPIGRLAADFLIAADSNKLDWRLLPSLSIIETGGGKGVRNNNIFGWNCGRTSFRSIKESIHVVAAKLSQSPWYRGKDTTGILKAYNSNPRYPERVKAVMQTIGSADLSAVSLAALN
ncbi:MAG: hypothetical protein DMF60_09795 [Acidobacteria bacterium]|nr:MAG: hypothetical protein DMF60_09795 [Acidobacteriota bacterium]